MDFFVFFVIFRELFHRVAKNKLMTQMEDIVSVYKGHPLFVQNINGGA